MSPCWMIFKRRNELRAEIAGPPVAAARERGERLDHRARAKAAAKIGFDAPNRRDRCLVHPETALRERERLAVAGHHRAAVADSFLINESGKVVPNRSLEFRLDLRHGEHVWVGREPARHFVEGGGFDAACERGAAKTRKAVRKARGTGFCGDEEGEAKSKSGEGSPDRANIVFGQSV